MKLPDNWEVEVNKNNVVEGQNWNLKLFQIYNSPKKVILS